MKPFTCQHCKREIAQSDGRRLRVGCVEIPLKVTTPVICGFCNKPTLFYVKREKKAALAGVFGV